MKLGMIRWYDPCSSPVPLPPNLHNLYCPTPYPPYSSSKLNQTSFCLLELRTLPLPRPLHSDRPLQRPPRRHRRLDPQQTHGPQL